MIGIRYGALAACADMTRRRGSPTCSPDDHNIRKLDELLPWNWKNDRAKLAA